MSVKNLCDDFMGHNELFSLFHENNMYMTVFRTAVFNTVQTNICSVTKSELKRLKNACKHDHTE